MEEAEFSEHVDELIGILGDEVDRERLYHELDNFVNIYKVSLKATSENVWYKSASHPLSR